MNLNPLSSYSLAQLADFGTADQVSSADSNRIRTDLPFSATDPDHPAREHPRFTSRGYRCSRSPCHRALLPITGYRDAFGNQCNRVVAPAGRIRLSADCVINDNGQPDDVVFGAGQDSVEDLPEESLVFLLGSRYCETDLLSETAWQLFSQRGSGVRSRAGDLRLRSSPHRIQLPERPRHAQRRRRFSTNAPASAATTRIWPSLSAAA